MSKRICLAFDSSGPHLVAAIVAGNGKLRASHYQEQPKGQAEALIPVCHDLIKQAGLDLRDISVIGVGIGPGNFTGVRISVSAARAFALGLSIPAIGVDAFHAYAFGLRNVVVGLPAPRDQLYVKSFSGQDRTPRICAASYDEFPEINPRAEPAGVGPAAEQVAGVLRTWTEESKYPLAEAIARIALERFARGPQPRPTPLYLRPADAAPARPGPNIIAAHER